MQTSEKRHIYNQIESNNTAPYKHVEPALKLGTLLLSKLKNMSHPYRPHYSTETMQQMSRGPPKYSFMKPSHYNQCVQKFTAFFCFRKRKKENKSVLYCVFILSFSNNRM